jgi:glycosyltransferase involved in cell wall biosynthesis
MPRIAFDLRTTHLSGIYRYGTSLLKSMEPLLPGAGAELFVLYRPGMRCLLLDEIGSASDNMEFVEVKGDYGFIRDSAWLRGWLLREGVDLYYSAHYLVDPELPVPFVYTIHDLIRIKYPDFSYTDQSFVDKFGMEEFSRMREALQELNGAEPTDTACSAGRGIFYNYFLAINHCLKEKATHIATVSNTVRRDLLALLSIPASKVTVVSNAVDAEVFHPRPSREVAQVLQKFGIGGPYCLYVGTGHKHKRLAWFLESLARHKNLLPAKGRLVLVGSHYDLHPGLQALIDARGLGKSVVFTGRVSDEELACLYSGTQVLIVSSVDEGFCLPVLEALACRAEVAVPDLPVFHEVADNCAHFYPPHDGDALAKAALNAFAGALPSRGKGFINRFSWHRSANDLLPLLLQWASKTRSVSSIEHACKEALQLVK